MGMTVFSGMLIATILGVCLIPMLFVVVERLTGGAKQHAAAPASLPPQTLATEHGQGATEMTRAPPLVRRLAVTAAAVVVWWRRVRSVPTTRGPQMPSPPQYRFVEDPVQAESLADVAVVAGLRRSDAAGADPRGDRQQPRPARGGRARRGGARARGHRQVVSLSAGRRRRQLRTAVSRRTRHESDDTTHQSGTYGFQLSWEIDLFGRLRRQQEAAIAWRWPANRAAAACSSRSSATSPPTTSCCASSICSSRSRGRRCALNDETVTYFQNRLDGGVSNRLELDRIQANRADDGRRDPVRSNSRLRIVENAISLLLGRPPGPIDA